MLFTTNIDETIFVRCISMNVFHYLDWKQLFSLLAKKKKREGERERETQREGEAGKGGGGK